MRKRNNTDISGSNDGNNEKLKPGEFNEKKSYKGHKKKISSKQEYKNIDNKVTNDGPSFQNKARHRKPEEQDNMNMINNNNNNNPRRGAVRPRRLDSVVPRDDLPQLPSTSQVQPPSMAMGSSHNRPANNYTENSNMMPIRLPPPDDIRETNPLAKREKKGDQQTDYKGLSRKYNEQVRQPNVDSVPNHEHLGTSGNVNNMNHGRQHPNKYNMHSLPEWKAIRTSSRQSSTRPPNGYLTTPSKATPNKYRKSSNRVINPISNNNFIAQQSTTTNNNKVVNEASFTNQYASSMFQTSIDNKNKKITDEDLSKLLEDFCVSIPNGRNIVDGILRHIDQKINYNQPSANPQDQAVLEASRHMLHSLMSELKNDKMLFAATTTTNTQTNLNNDKLEDTTIGIKRNSIHTSNVENSTIAIAKQRDELEIDDTLHSLDEKQQTTTGKSNAINQCSYCRSKLELFMHKLKVLLQNELTSHVANRPAKGFGAWLWEPVTASFTNRLDVQVVLSERLIRRLIDFPAFGIFITFMKVLPIYQRKVLSLSGVFNSVSANESAKDIDKRRNEWIIFFRCFRGAYRYVGDHLIEMLMKESSNHKPHAKKFELSISEQFKERLAEDNKAKLRQENREKFDRYLLDNFKTMTVKSEIYKNNKIQREYKNNDESLKDGVCFSDLDDPNVVWKKDLRERISKSVQDIDSKIDIEYPSLGRSLFEKRWENLLRWHIFGQMQFQNAEAYVSQMSIEGRIKKNRLHQKVLSLQGHMEDVMKENGKDRISIPDSVVTSTSLLQKTFGTNDLNNENNNDSRIYTLKDVINALIDARA